MHSQLLTACWRMPNHWPTSSCLPAKSSGAVVQWDITGYWAGLGQLCGFCLFPARCWGWGVLGSVLAPLCNSRNISVLPLVFSWSSKYSIMSPTRKKIDHCSAHRDTVLIFFCFVSHAYNGHNFWKLFFSRSVPQIILSSFLFWFSWSWFHSLWCMSPFRKCFSAGSFLLWNLSELLIYSCGAVMKSLSLQPCLLWDTVVALTVTLWCGSKSELLVNSSLQLIAHRSEDPFSAEQGPFLISVCRALQCCRAEQVHGYVGSSALRVLEMQLSSCFSRLRCCFSRAQVSLALSIHTC